jgi:hypothetical protein
LSSVSPPLVANGASPTATGSATGCSTFDAATGQQLGSGTAFEGPTFAAPTVTDGHLFVGSWDDTLRAFGP